MHVISYRRFREFWAKHPDSETPLKTWYKNASKASWKNFADVRAVHPHADFVDGFTVFNVGGNKYRLITNIHFDSQLVLVRHVLTHHEYDKGHWKHRPPKV